MHIPKVEDALAVEEGTRAAGDNARVVSEVGCPSGVVESALVARDDALTAENARAASEGARVVGDGARAASESTPEGGEDALTAVVL